MKKTVFITGVTRMYGGFVCISGIEHESGKFVRPVIHYPERTGIRKEFLFRNRELVIRPLVNVELDFVKSEPKSEYHTEDWEINPACPPVLKGIPGMKEKQSILDRYLDSSVENALAEQSRSLVIVKSQGVPYINISIKEDSLKTHLTFRDSSGALQRRLPVTDANWLAVTRWLYGKHRGNAAKTADNLKYFLQGSSIYIRIGVTREFRGQKWRQVSGVFSFPDWLAGHTFVDYGYDFDDHV